MRLNGRLIGLIVLALIITAAALVLGEHERTASSTASPLPVAASPAGPGARVIATLPEFMLEDERGQPFGLDDLLGQVWIADFIFTRCAGTCPLITQRMAALSKQLAAAPATREVKLVSFSVDPAFDTPAVLSAYARQSGADPQRWRFLTGARGVMRGLVEHGFLLPIGDGADPATPIIHSQNFVLVDAQGRIRGVYDALDEGARRDLDQELARLLAEPQPLELGVPADVAHPAWLADQEKAQRASASAIAAPHDFQFTDWIGESGITFRHGSSVDVGKYYRAIHYNHGTAVAVADVDGDGLPDLFFVNQIGKSALYRNLGGDRFEDITESAGLAIGGDRACVGASFADIDNDGDPDLFVTCIRDGNLLFENDGHGHFKDITAQAGVAGTHGHSSGAVFFDFDGDGLLDLFVTNVGVYTTEEKRQGSPYVGVLDAFAGHLHPERTERSILYKNLGGNRFQDVTESSGLKNSGWSGDAVPFDYDGDGRTDLYVLNMQGQNELWRNLGGGKFEAVGRRVVPATPWGAMGVQVLDWNGDGKLDLYVTDMHTDMAGELKPGDEKKKHDPATMFPLRFLGTDGNHVLGNALYTNLGEGKFVEQSDLANVESGWPWGPSAGDLNADGWPDLFIAAGMNYPFRYLGNIVDPQRGRKEVRRRAVRARRRAAGAAGAALVHARVRRRGLAARPLPRRGGAGDDRQAGAAQAASAARARDGVGGARERARRRSYDLDGDGDLDIVTNNQNDVPQLLIGDLAQRHTVHSLSVRLAGTTSNRQGLGAVVTVKAGGRAQVQQNDGKSGYLAQSVLPLYFGLGDADHADALEVRWPSGKKQRLRGPLPSGKRC